ncbi:MAG: hypothetical protein H6936_02335 [Burkholderiales bacterium]|nr:hypothetical protein [Nitrosomonas sp.]MCP5273693.1 hypothetical protein [Burkholderiales bacterium]
MATRIGTNANDVLIGVDDKRLVYKNGGWSWTKDEGDLLSGRGGDDFIVGLGTGDYLWGGMGNDFLDGGGGDDHLFGDSGKDFLNGGKGEDYMSGGAGNDTYIVDNKEDIVIEADRREQDTIIVHNLGYYILPEYVENLTFLPGSAAGSYAGTTVVGFGNVQSNTIIGSKEHFNNLKGDAGTDWLYGQKKRDHLYGDAGDDFLYGDEGGDTLFGGSGHDRLFGEDGSDTLYGGGGDDLLIGGDGSDTLTGGGGDDYILGGLDKDNLRGGEGSDIFAFTNRLDSYTTTDCSGGGDGPCGIGPGRIDKIYDFEHIHRDDDPSRLDYSKSDKLDFRAIDADLNKPGHQRFYLSQFEYRDNVTPDGYGNLFVEIYGADEFLMVVEVKLDVMMTAENGDSFFAPNRVFDAILI